MIIVILGVFVSCFVLERAVPGWRLPSVRTWPLRVLLVNCVQLGVVLLAGITWERWLARWSMFHLSAHVAAPAGGTPRWVGFFFQRPEMHRIHHRPPQEQLRRHWWDMLFGTYENPTEWTHTCGFDAEKEEQPGLMLAFRDVHKPKH